MENILQVWPHFTCKQTPEKRKNILLQNKQRVYILVAAMGIQNPISKHLLVVIIKEKLDI